MPRIIKALYVLLFIMVTFYSVTTTSYVLFAVTNGVMNPWWGSAFFFTAIKVYASTVEMLLNTRKKT